MTTNMPSLLESISVPAPARRPGLRERLHAAESRLLNAARSRWAYQMAEPRRRTRTLGAVWIGGLLLISGLGVGGYLVFGPRPQPDYDTAGLDEVFDYTLLTDEFNRLPVEERLKLIGKLVNRLKNMSAGDSVLLAAFAAGIAGSARQQLEENASRLAIDLWDSYAQDYTKVTDADRARYLEDTFLKFMKTMEAVAGESRDISDAERLNELQEQIDRDRKEVAEHPERVPDSQALGRIAQIMETTVGGNATPQQRQRGQLLMRDMARHFRGQDLATGKPK